MKELLLCFTVLAFGSFANNIISYFSGNATLDIKRSRCFCEKEIIIKYRHLIPILSFILLRGKCAYCNTKIPIRYFYTEILVLSIGFLMLFKYGYSVYGLMDFIVYYTLFIIAIIDYNTFKIPNKLILALILIGFIQMSLPGRTDISLSITSALLFLIILSSIYFIVLKYTGKIFLGYGDIKLISVCAIILNYQEILFAIWLASLIGLCVFVIDKAKYKKDKSNKVPFGFYLFWGFLIADLIYDRLSTIYLSIIME